MESLFPVWIWILAANHRLPALEHLPQMWAVAGMEGSKQTQPCSFPHTKGEVHVWVSGHGSSHYATGIPTKKSSKWKQSITWYKIWISIYTYQDSARLKRFFRCHSQDSPMALFISLHRLTFTTKFTLMDKSPWSFGKNNNQKTKFVFHLVSKNSKAAHVVLPLFYHHNNFVR